MSLEFLFLVANVRWEEPKKNMKTYWNLSEAMAEFYISLMSCSVFVLDLDSFQRRRILDLFHATWQFMWASGDKTVLEMPGMHEQVVWWPHYSLYRDTDISQTCRSLEMLQEE